MIDPRRSDDDIVMSVRGLTKIYPTPEGDDIVAAEDVTFDLHRSESLALVGESGSGKSTVARMCVGLETPSAGEVFFDSAGAGGAEERSTGRSRVVQMVFQDPATSLDPRQKIGRGLVELLVVGRGLDRCAAAVRSVELLERVGLDARHATVRPGMLSGGQRQRVAIARALALEPEVLILDEAVSALDVSVQAQILNLLAEIRASGPIAFLFITHDLAVVRQVADSAIVMRRGHIVESGPVDRVLDEPRHDYTRTLIDAIPRPGWRPSRSTSHETDRRDDPPGG